MRVRGMVAMLAGAIATAVLLGSAGAGTAMGGEGAGTGSVARGGGASLRADLSSRQAIARYLRSVGISQRGIVVQRGLRNYAGPRCPGKRWNCTTALRVVQVGLSSHGGPVNKTECFAVSCEIVQVAPPNADNEAKCHQETGASQWCRIEQQGHTNVATVVQKILQKNLPAREGRQKAFVVQTASGSSNTSNVTQSLVQHTNVRSSGSIAQSLQGDQFVDVQQNGPGNTSNTANTFQHLKQDAIGRTSGQATSVGQLLNAADLDPMTPRNTSAVIDQTSGTGPNSASRRQVHELSAVATAVGGAITQVQGSPDGGLEGLSDDDVHQESTGPASSDNDQTKRLNLSATTAGALSQTQEDPAWCCSQQIGDSTSLFTLDQSSTTLASDPDADQTIQLRADVQSTGTVTVNQTTNVDGEVRTDSCTGTSCEQQIDTGSDTPPQATVGNTDVASFGFGGMRGDGTGSITVSGVSGQVRRALLYWNGPTNSSSPTANAAVTFAGAPVTGSNIGFSHDNCWGFANSQSYRADVTSLVAGNGTYSLAGFVKPDVEVNGVSLVVFFDDGNTANNRSVVFFDGNDSNITNPFDADGWNITLTGVDYPAGGGSASLDFVVSDGQAFPDAALVLNGQTFVPEGAIFEGDSVPGGPGGFQGNLWDVESFDLTDFLTVGPNTLSLTTGVASDCLSAVYVAANVPAAEPPIE